MRRLLAGSGRGPGCRLVGRGVGWRHRGSGHRRRRAQATRADDAEQALAEKFAPVVSLVHQDVECGPGEPYQPSDVDLVLGDPSVASARGLGRGRHDPGRPDGRGSERGPLRLPPGLPRQPARGRVRLRGVGPGRGCGPAADDVRPRGDRGRRGRPAGPAVLVLLPVQRLHQQARGRLGDGPARLRCRRRDAGDRSDTARDRLQPARRARGRRLGRPEARHRRRQSSRRECRRRITRQLLRLGAAPRHVRRAGVRVRRHARSGRRREPPLSPSSLATPRPRRPSSRGSPSRGAGDSARRPSTTGRPARTPRRAGPTRSATRTRRGATSATRFLPAVSWAPRPPTSSAARSPAVRRSSASSPTIPGVCS